MDQRSKDEILETLKLFGVEAGTRESCLQDLTSAFDSYRMRMRRKEEDRREIETELRLESTIADPDQEPTDLQIALTAADSSDTESAGHWPTVAGVLAFEYRKVHSALVKLDGIYRHDMDHPGFRPDWLRDAIAGESEWEREHVMDIPHPKHMATPEEMRRVIRDLMDTNEAIPRLEAHAASLHASLISANELHRLLMEEHEEMRRASLRLTECLKRANANHEKYERLWLLRAVPLEDFASQKLTSELDDEQMDAADFEYAYNEMVKLSRRSLAETSGSAASESQRGAAESADEKPDGQAENAPAHPVRREGQPDTTKTL